MKQRNITLNDIQHNGILHNARMTTFNQKLKNALYFKIWQYAYFSKTKPKIKSGYIAIIEENVLKEWKK